MVNSIQHHHHHELHRKGAHKRSKPKVGVYNSESAFRRKYTGFLMVSVFGTVLFFMSVVFFNTVSNYDLFKKLAFTTNPELVSHLERELTGFYFLFAAGLTSVFLFCVLIGMKITKSVSMTLAKLQKHFSRISKQDWSAQEFNYSLNDDHADLLMNYAVFYRSLREDAQNELHNLEKITNDTHDPHIKSRLQELCSQKRKKLGLPAETIDEKSASLVLVREKNRAS